jgi:hypothetical protein
MAQNTALNIILQAKDWELLMGIIMQSADPKIQDILFQLSTYYRAQATKPLQTDNISIATTEVVVLQLAGYLYGCTTSYVTKDTGASPFNRILTAFRALNNVADNYINTSFVTFDAAYAAAQNTLKKQGRNFIMMLQYDNQ